MLCRQSAVRISRQMFETEDNKVSSKDNNQPYVQIMMMGGRRTGKTSMLASIYGAFNNVVMGSDLKISKTGGKQIDVSLERMNSIFRMDHILNEPVDGLNDYESTKGFDFVDFTLSINGKKNQKVIRCVDIAGEWFNERANEEGIATVVEKSDVFIITVDTVFLMERNGLYNGENAISSVTEFLKNNLNPEKTINQKKLILFVPTKCEKYYHQHFDKQSPFYHKKWDEIYARIREEYKDLLAFLEAPANRKYFTIAMLPVLTLGGVEFDEFLSDGMHGKIPSDKVQYRYCKPDKYEPKFCDRPLIYSLLFVQKKLQDDYYSKAYNGAKKKLSAILSEWFSERLKKATDPDFIKEFDLVTDSISDSSYYHGVYKMVQDPDGIELRKDSMAKPEA